MAQRRLTTILTAILGAGALAIGPVAPANAEQPGSQVGAAERDLGAPDVRLYVRGSSETVELTPEFVSANALPDHDQSRANARLISWDQWFGCFTLNNEADIFGEYAFPWDGDLRPVRLKCGNATYGYKHIRNKESNWQDKLDTARAYGWNSGHYGIQSWDDLMSATTAAIVRFPDYMAHNSVGNKWCSNTELFLQDVKTGKPVYSFRAEAAWASDSDRLISTFPSSRQVC
ncbi:hypothetical protein [Leifsonia sp. NCR5]|uniref:hypothetical protein n=1 Tax=Leifsonia sp. NCR5 TaxID=1978342 RepID=UPI00117ACBA4|nr:hypothetical protein [Leifsonia sp. NCR5]